MPGTLGWVMYGVGVVVVAGWFAWVMKKGKRGDE